MPPRSPQILPAHELNARRRRIAALKRLPALAQTPAAPPPLPEPTPAVQPANPPPVGFSQAKPSLRPSQTCPRANSLLL